MKGTVGAWDTVVHDFVLQVGRLRPDARQRLQSAWPGAGSGLPARVENETDMTGQTIVEKIMSAHAGTPARAGEICICTVDAAMGTDGSVPMAIDYFEAMGGTALHDPDGFVVALDHYAPETRDRTFALQDRVREFLSTHGGRLYDVGEGIGHQLMIERGHVTSGGLYVGADSHAVTYGALNCMAVGIGSSDLAAVMLTGALWFFVPETIRVDFHGRLRPGVTAKDVALWLTGTLKSDGAAYQALEFGGPGLAALSVDDRIVIANMTAECGAKCGLFACDHATLDYLRSAGARDGVAVAPDEGAAYVRRITLDLDALEPMVALPHAPDNVRPLAEAENREVDLVYLGTCTGGRLSDFHDALAVLEAGGGVAPSLAVYVTPASAAVHAALVADGSAAAFTRLGAIMMPPGCGACCGTCGFIPGDGRRVISTANRNFRGRMGNRNAEITLASPVACAAAACRGRIVDPRKVLDA